MRKLLIGDIHGNDRGLIDVLDAAAYDKEYDQIICIGDYVDGWSESCEVIDFLIALETQAVHKPIFIRGNHDVWCEKFLHGEINPHWMTQGGEATILSYKNNPDINMEHHRSFFRRLHNYWIDDENRAFVHGGYKSPKGLGHESTQYDYGWDRDLWGLAMILHRTKDIPTNDDACRNQLYKEIYIGHTATTGYNCKPHYPEYNDPKQPTKNGPITVPMNRLNIWNVDTGGGFYGKLTIMDIDTKEYWQAQNSRVLYPNEMTKYYNKKKKK